MHSFAPAALLLAVLLAALPARADDHTDVNRLIQSGRLSEALQRAEKHLSTRPRDPQMRFLQGVIFSETDKQAQALEVFLSITQDYPELPEPYNNLAVRQAALGQLDQARASLETATRLDPSYATAHENLGDIYAQMAARSYGQAQVLDRARSSVERKLVLVRQLMALNAPVRLAPPSPITLPPAPVPLRRK